MRLMAHDAAALNYRQVDGFASPEQTADVGYAYAVSCDGFIMTPKAERIGFILQEGISTGRVGVMTVTAS